jgi:putative transposase
VPVRVSATDRIRTKIDALFAEDRELPEILEEVARLGAQLLMQAALEAEVTEFLGRERYQRSAACPDANDGSRNGYRPVTIKTTTGPVTLERPKLRGTTAAFASRLFGKHVTKTNALETLVIAAFVRGLSVRDVEATLAEALGDQAAISKSTVSEICKAIRAEYQAWARRRLDEIMLDYLFLDASFFRMHPGSPASRCWPPGASPPRASRCSSGCHLGPASPPTLGRLFDRSARTRPWHSAAGRL